MNKYFHVSTLGLQGGALETTLLGAAKGPGDYNGTMSRAELEREAGEKVFTSINEETRNALDKSGNNYDPGKSYNGWVKMPDGTWERQTSSWSSWSSSSQSGKDRVGITYDNQIRNGNDYQGSGNGINYESGSSDSGWVTMPDGTRDRKTIGLWSSWSSSYQSGTDNSGGKSRTGQTHFSSSNSMNSYSNGGQNSFGSGYSSSTSSSPSSSSSGGSSSSLPKGQWVWNQSADDGKGKWEWSTNTDQESRSHGEVLDHNSTKHETGDMEKDSTGTYLS